MVHAKSFTGWRGLLANQDWALAPIFIICACVAWFGNDDPKGKWQYYRSWNVTMPGTGQVLPNPTVIYPHNKDTIPYWVAIVVPGLAFILSMVVIEGMLLKGRRISQVFSAMLLFSCSNTTSLFATGALTELFKTLCGRLRPDFLWRTGSEVLDGRRSFPSGHSSSAYAICWYGAFYILWSLHWRYSQAWQAKQRRWELAGESFQSMVLRRVWSETLSGLLLLLAMAELAFAWGIGASRFRDNRHHPSDIVGGFVLALTFAPLFLWRAASLLEFNETAQAKLLAEEQGQQQQQHAAVAGMAPLQEVCVAAGDAPLKPHSADLASSGTPPWKQAPAGGAVQMAHQGPHI